MILKGSNVFSYSYVTSFRTTNLKKKNENMRLVGFFSVPETQTLNDLKVHVHVYHFNGQSVLSALHT